MKVVGILSLLFGLLLGLLSLTMDVSVESSSSYSTTRVANMEKMNYRQTLMTAAGALGTIGAIFIGFGTLADTRNIPTSQSAEEESILETIPNGITRKKNGLYVVGEHSFDHLHQAETFLREEEALRKAQV